MFGSTPIIFPFEAKEGWDYWSQATSTMEPYMKDVQYLIQFNVAWIFSWEYRFQSFLPIPHSLSLIRAYKIKWWSEFKTRLCGKENVKYFCKTNKKKFTLHNLHLFEKPQIAPATPTKKEKSSSSSSKTKAKRKGLSQKEKDLLAYLKYDPDMKQIVFKKFLTNKGTLMMMTLLVQQHHPHRQNLTIYKILRIPTNYNTMLASA